MSSFIKKLMLAFILIVVANPLYASTPIVDKWIELKNGKIDGFNIICRDYNFRFERKIHGNISAFLINEQKVQKLPLIKLDKNIFSLGRIEGKLNEKELSKWENIMKIYSLKKNFNLKKYGTDAIAIEFENKIIKYDTVVNFEKNQLNQKNTKSLIGRTKLNIQTDIKFYEDEFQIPQNGFDQLISCDLEY